MMTTTPPPINSSDEFRQQKEPIPTNKEPLDTTVNSVTNSSLSYLGWEWLPKHILDIILDKLISLYDYLAFKTVCKSWYTVAQDNKRRRCFINASHHQLPLLLIPVKDSEERRLYNVVRDKVYDFRVNVPLFRCCGSSHGWLFILEETKSLTMLNPFTNRTINLPPIVVGDEPFGMFFVWKAVLSKDPELFPDDYEVAIIYDGMRRFALYHVKTKTWTHFSDNQDQLSLFKDVIYHKKIFYVIDRWMGVGKIDISNIQNSVSLPEVSLVVPRSLLKWSVKRTVCDTHLVEASDGDLLLVQRILFMEDFEWTPDIGNDEEDDFTVKFKVFKISSESDDDGLTKPVYVRDLGDYAMFLGYNYSMLISIFEFPGLQRNCIYYTNDRMDPYNPLDAGIYNLESGEIIRHYTPDSDKELPPTTWIVPTLQGDWK